MSATYDDLFKKYTITMEGIEEPDPCGDGPTFIPGSQIKTLGDYAAYMRQGPPPQNPFSPFTHEQLKTIGAMIELLTKMQPPTPKEKNMKYKNSYFGSDDKLFWEEVLVGRKIESIHYDQQLYSLTLDNGEKVYAARSDAGYVRVVKVEEEKA